MCMSLNWRRHLNCEEINVEVEVSFFGAGECTHLHVLLESSSKNTFTLNYVNNLVYYSSWAIEIQLLRFKCIFLHMLYTWYHFFITSPVLCNLLNVSLITVRLGVFTEARIECFSQHLVGEKDLISFYSSRYCLGDCSLKLEIQPLTLHKTMAEPLLRACVVPAEHNNQTTEFNQHLSYLCPCSQSAGVLNVTVLLLSSLDDNPTPPRAPAVRDDKPNAMCFSLLWLSELFCLCFICLSVFMSSSTLECFYVACLFSAFSLFFINNCFKVILLHLFVSLVGRVSSSSNANSLKKNKNKVKSVEAFVFQPFPWCWINEILLLQTLVCLSWPQTLSHYGYGTLSILLLFF